MWPLGPPPLLKIGSAQLEVERAVCGLQANRGAEDSRAEGVFSPSARAGRSGGSPLSRPHAVPEWLSSPRSTPSSSKHLTPESTSGLFDDRTEGISPGSLHRLNVFSQHASRRVSSDASAEAAVGVSEDGAEAPSAYGQQQQEQEEVIAAGHGQNAEQVMPAHHHISSFLLISGLCSCLVECKHAQPGSTLLPALYLTCLQCWLTAPSCRCRNAWCCRSSILVAQMF